MGNTNLDIKNIAIRTSAYNSPKDDRDRFLMSAFVIELEELMERYRKVGLDVEYGHADDD